MAPPSPTVPAPHGPRLSLVQVTTLRELARRGTLAAAAARLGYTPGAVSQHLASLETTLGVALVERSGRHLVLTDAGRVMVDHAEELLAAESRAVSAVRAAREQVAGPLVVGTWGSSAAGLLAPVVTRLAEAFPEVAVTSREVDLDGASAAVRHGEVDVAFGLDYDDAPLPRDRAVARTLLEPEEFAVAVVAGTSTTARRDALDGAALRELDWILPPEGTQYGRALRSGLRRRDVEPRVVHEVTDTAASLQLAAAGLGATLATPLMLRLAAQRATDLDVVRMPDPITRRIALLARSDVEQRQPVRVFVEEAATVVAQLLASLAWST